MVTTFSRLLILYPPLLPRFPRAEGAIPLPPLLLAALQVSEL